MKYYTITINGVDYRVQATSLMAAIKQARQLAGA